VLFAWLTDRGDLHSSLVMAITGMVYFVLNTGSVAVILGLTSGKNLTKVWREYHFWSFPYYLIGSAG
jgi:hypothetical protein